MQQKLQSLENVRLIVSRQNVGVRLGWTKGGVKGASEGM
jgi:hypothetical protein